MTHQTGRDNSSLATDRKPFIGQSADAWLNPLRLLKMCVCLAAATMIVSLAWLNWRLYSAPRGAANVGETSADAFLQLENIGRRLRAGEGTDMQRLFPEGWFFSHALYGMAWINVGLQSQDRDARQKAAAEARWVLQKMETPEGIAPFQAATQVEHGVFYSGWRNRLLGGLFLLGPDVVPTAVETDEFHQRCEQFAAAFRQHATLHLDAYPGKAWPCDNVMALASLRVHDAVFGLQYGDVIGRWVAYTKEHLDPRTELIVHRIDGETGQMLIPARASSLVYILSFLPELDAEFARDQYAKYRRLYVQDWLGYLPVREYPWGTPGGGDVDTGPLILGISPSATVVSIAAARANRDAELVDRNVILSETIGGPWTWGKEKSFGFGRILVADAFLVWGKSLTPWMTIDAVDFPPTTPLWWKLRVHGVSLVVMGMLAMIMRQLVGKRNLAKP